MESECEKKTVESNARYFLSAIVSSSSKSVTKEEAMIKQERNKLNPSPEASTMMVEYDSKSELPSRKRKNKKEAFSVEKISMDNRNSSNCMAPCQSEEIIEPTRKKKKLKNKMKETQVENTSTDNDTVSKCTAPCPSEEVKEPSRKKINLKENINENLVEKMFTDNDAVSKCTAPCQFEEMSEPTRKKKKLKNKINETRVEKTSTDNYAVSKCTAPCQLEEIIEPNRKKKKLKNKINGNLAEKKFIDNDADSVSRERDIAYCMAHCREVLQFPAQKISCTAPCQSEETIAPTHIKKTYKNDIGKILPMKHFIFYLNFLFIFLLNS